MAGKSGVVKLVLVGFSIGAAIFAALSLIGYVVLANSWPPTPAVTPTAGARPAILILPEEGRPGDVIAVVGEGWLPGDTVFIRLGGPEDAALASAVVGGDGRFTASFTFQPGSDWADASRVLVTAWSPATGEEAFAVLRVVELSPTATPGPFTPQPTPTAACTDRASFVADVTVPDGARFLPGQAFVKTWRLRNSGTCTWSQDYALVFVGGDRLGGPASVPLPGAVAPGETVDLSVALVAPAAAGSYRGSWQLCDAAGVRFGASATDGVIWVQIVVGPAATSTSIPTPTPTPAPVITAWRGEYFANVTLVGAPTLVRNDAAINFDWGQGAPAAGLPQDGFSARWTRVMAFEGGAYRFWAVVDDGVRVYIDDALVIDAWRDGGRRLLEAGDVRLAGGNHGLRVEYYERTGEALVQVGWERVNAYPDWRGEYWSNREMKGSAAVVRNDAAVDFDWGKGAPAAGLPTDDFSARWTRRVTFGGGTYRFHVLVDDGARLWVDDRLIVDTWRDGSVREVTADLALVQGAHDLKVAYYEHGGDARIKVWWEKVAKPVFPDWKGAYWTNRKLDGDPALVRNDKAIDFQWGKGAADVGLPVDNFSARWSRKVAFSPGVYRFYAWADDGIRVYVRDRLVLDEWHDNDGNEVYVFDLAVDGDSKVVVEYYERGGNALVKFWWKRLGGLPTPTPLPPTPTMTPTTEITIAVRLNEVLAVPAQVDWNGDGGVDGGDAWVELYNPGAAAVDLGGWVLEDGLTVTVPYTIPQGTVLAPGAFGVFYSQETGLALGDGGQVHLFRPRGVRVDGVVYGALLPDASYARDAEGVWHVDWLPSPGGPNVPWLPVR